MTGPPYVTINDLLPEILHQILSYFHPVYPVTPGSLHDDKYDGRSQTSSLTTFARTKRWFRDVSTVNQFWYDAALPFIYAVSCLTMHSSYRVGTLHRLEQIKKHGDLVRYLIVTLAYDNSRTLTRSAVTQFEDLGPYHPGCLVIHADIRGQDSLDPIVSLFRSFDYPGPSVRSIRIGSLRVQPHETMSSVLHSIPTVVASQLELLGISGWEVPPTTDTELLSLQGRFPLLRAFPLDRLDLSSVPPSERLNLPFSMTSPSKYLTFLALAKTLIDFNSIITVLKTPVPLENSTYSYSTTVGEHLTKLHLNIFQPQPIDTTRRSQSPVPVPTATPFVFDTNNAPFFIVSLCPNLTKFSYFTPTPTTFLLPSPSHVQVIHHGIPADEDSEALVSTSTSTSIVDMPDGPIATLPYLTELGLRIVPKTWGGTTLLAGHHAIDAIIEWGKNPRMRGTVKTLVVRCDFEQGFDEAKEKVERELGDSGGGGLEVKMVGVRKPDTRSSTEVLDDQDLVAKNM